MAGPTGMSAIAAELLLKAPPLPLLNVDTPAPPLISAIEHNLLLRQKRKDLQLPNLAHKDIDTILVFSDFGGEDSKAQYNTYSFLFAGYQLLEPVLTKLKVVRRRHKLMEPFREVCFKEFRYGPIGRCIPEWLHTADVVTGLLFTLVVPKKVYSLIGADEKATPEKLAAEMKEFGLPNWKGSEAEKALRIVHVLGYFLALLTRKGQNVCWICDNDAIFANPVRIEHVKQLWSNQLAKYGHGSYGKKTLGLPFEKTADTYSVCDLLSIPDLAAGCIQAILVEKEKGTDARIRLQTNDVLLWLAHQSVFLKKMTIHVRTNASGQIEVGSTFLIPLKQQSHTAVGIAPTEAGVNRTLKKMRVKIALTHKYERLARKAGSEAKRKNFTRKSRKYDRQASSLLWHGDEGHQ